MEFCGYLFSSQFTENEMVVVLDTLGILISSPVHSAEQESFLKFSSNSLYHYISTSMKKQFQMAHFKLSVLNP